MAKVRLIADEPRIVPWLDNRLVEPDEVVDVPDGDAESYACQPAVWELVAEPKKAPAKAVKGSED